MPLGQFLGQITQERLTAFEEVAKSSNVQQICAHVKGLKERVKRVSYRLLLLWLLLSPTTTAITTTTTAATPIAVVTPSTSTVETLVASLAATAKGLQKLNNKLRF